MTLNFDPDHVHALAADLRRSAQRCRPASLSEQAGSLPTREFLRALADATARLNTHSAALQARLETIAADADTTARSAVNSDNATASGLGRLL